MATWFFEPGHTAAEFCVRPMMVTNVRGRFKDVYGTLAFDPNAPHNLSVEVTIDATGLSSGEPDRDEHLKSVDFLDVQTYPEITFKGNQADITEATPICPPECWPEAPVYRCNWPLSHLLPTLAFRPWAA